MTSTFLFFIILSLITYYVSLAINGVFQTIIAEQLGDTTAKELGFAYPNPFRFVDMVNFFVLVFFRFGITTILPLNPFNLTEPHRYIKAFILYFSEPFLNLITASFSIIIPILMFGFTKTLKLLKLFLFGMGWFKTINFNVLPPFSLQSLIGLIFIAMVHINIILAICSLVFNLFKYILYIGIEKKYWYLEYYDYLISLMPFLTVAATFSILSRIFTNLILNITYKLLQIIGI